MPITRDQLVDKLIGEYRANGQQAAIKMFGKMVKEYEISQHGMAMIIHDFQSAIDWKGPVTE